MKRRINGGRRRPRSYRVRSEVRSGEAAVAAPGRIEQESVGRRRLGVPIGFRLYQAGSRDRGKEENELGVFPGRIEQGPRERKGKDKETKEENHMPVVRRQQQRGQF